MKQAFHLASRYLIWNRGQSLTVMFSLSVMIWIPLTVRMALHQFEREIAARGKATPLVIGARGSRTDLVLHTLYFEAPPAETVPWSEVDRINQSGLGTAIPLHLRFRTQPDQAGRSAPLAGTSPEYFEFRGLSPRQGTLPVLLGDCVLGSRFAESSGLQPGDTLLSAPRNTLDLAGDYPLRMNITGVLQESGSADDDAVFIDVRTAWVIEGIGHGHQEVNRETDPSLLLNNTDDQSVTASAAILPWLEITDENRDSFHFHGDLDEFPLTSVIVSPRTEKQRVLILGRYADSGSRLHCVRPPQVINELLNVVFRMEQLIRFASLAAGLVTAALLGLVLRLSLKLRAAELQTLFRLGCSQATILTLQTAEIILLAVPAIAIALTAAAMAADLAGKQLRMLLF